MWYAICKASLHGPGTTATMEADTTPYYMRGGLAVAMSCLAIPRVSQIAQTTKTWGRGCRARRMLTRRLCLLCSRHCYTMPLDCQIEKFLWSSLTSFLRSCKGYFHGRLHSVIRPMKLKRQVQAILGGRGAIPYSRGHIIAFYLGTLALYHNLT